MVTRNNTDRSDNEIVLTLLCAVQVLHETLDDLQHTKIYKHSVKQIAKRFEEELTKAYDPLIKQVLPDDEDVFNLIMQGISSVGKKFASLDPAVIGKLAITIEQEIKNHKDELERISSAGGENDVVSVSRK